MKHIKNIIISITLMISAFIGGISATESESIWDSNYGLVVEADRDDGTERTYKLRWWTHEPKEGDAPKSVSLTGVGSIEDSAVFWSKKYPTMTITKFEILEGGKSKQLLVLDHPSFITHFLYHPQKGAWTAPKVWGDRKYIMDDVLIGCHLDKLKIN